MRTVKIAVSDVSKTFEPAGLPALDRVRFEVLDGEFLCLLGPSGCGKTTLLRIAAGLLPPSSGSVVRNGETPGRVFAGMVFQDLALLPWRTVQDNVSLGPRLRGASPRETEEIAALNIRKIQLSGFEAYYPRQLSGGMKQRVALARAFACDPEVFLMDEPFNALDACTRRLLQDELLRIWEERRKTVLFVTHSIEEALLLADRVVLLTSRPARVREVLEVPFPRPRRQGLRGQPAFGELSERIWALLEEEVRRGSFHAERRAFPGTSPDGRGGGHDFRN